MWKKLILGGVAVAATGYGIKKLYDLHYEDELAKLNSTQKDDEEFEQESDELENNTCFAENLKLDEGAILEIKDENGNILHSQGLDDKNA